MKRFLLRLLAASFAISADAALARAMEADPDASGTIEGRVLDKRTGNPLPGASVHVDGTSASVSTDRSGEYRLAGVPAGSRTLVVSYLGRGEGRITVDVPAGAAVKADVELEPLAYKESVTVSAEFIRDAQARALNQQKTAPNITNIVSADQIGSFPDPNAAETTQRIPGVSIQRDMGEGRYVIIRGTEPRLNSMMVDGERIPAPDPLLRQVAVDVIPSDLLQAIEVSKALTPDMDADAIGGSVNLVMKEAPEDFRLFGSIGGGYNQMLESFHQNTWSLTTGRRFAGNKLGVIVSGSGSIVRRGNQDLEVVYTPANTLQELNPRWYQVNRRRLGFTGGLDYKPDGGSKYYLRGVFNRFIDDHENRQRVRSVVPNRRIDRELRDRTHIERVSSLTVGGDRLLRTGGTFDYKLVGAYSDQVDPLTMTKTFRHTNVNFEPNVTPNSIDPDNVQANPLNESLSNYNFLQQIRATNFSKDRDIVGAANLRLPAGKPGHVTTFVKFGAKLRDKSKGRTRNETTTTTRSTLKLTDFLETGFDLRPYLDGRYDLSPYTRQSAVAGIPDLVPVTVVPNHVRDAENFDGTERTAAGYVMAEIFVGPKLYLLPGLRYEYTWADYTGRDVHFAPNGTYLSTTPISSTSNFGVALPGLHARYAVTPNTNVRAAFTRSLARPNYYDIVPYRAQDDSASTITLGNAALKPTRSWNADLLAEHYFKSVGVVSAGAFYKHLDDYIFLFTFPQQVGGTQYQVTQPLNGEAASVKGIEIALQNQLRFLPSPLDGLGLYANYTYTDSSAVFPARAGKNTLPGQSKNVGNVAASYEKGGFFGRVSVNFHGAYVDVVGASSLLDRYYDRHTQLDVSLNQKITKNVRIYASGLNLNDAKLRYYQGVTERVLQEEHYHWWTEVGLKLDF
jgi:TonB-dependent receptor